MELLTIPLSQNESKELADISQHISSQASRDLDTIVKLARNIVPEVREQVPEVVSQLRLLLDPQRTPGAIVISDFPQVEDPHCLSILATFLLGEPIKYVDEGEYVVEVKSRPMQDIERPSF